MFRNYKENLCLSVQNRKLALNGKMSGQETDTQQQDLSCQVDSESLKRKKIALTEASIMETRMSCHIEIIRQKGPVNSDGYLSCKS